MSMKATPRCNWCCKQRPCTTNTPSKFSSRDVRCLKTRPGLWHDLAAPDSRLTHNTLVRDFRKGKTPGNRLNIARAMKSAAVEIMNVGAISSSCPKGSCAPLGHQSRRACMTTRRTYLRCHLCSTKLCLITLELKSGPVCESDSF